MARAPVNDADKTLGFDRDDRMYCACQTGLHDDVSEYCSLIESADRCFSATDTRDFTATRIVCVRQS